MTPIETVVVPIATALIPLAVNQAIVLRRERREKAALAAKTALDADSETAKAITSLTTTVRDQASAVTGHITKFDVHVRDDERSFTTQGNAIAELKDRSIRTETKVDGIDKKVDHIDTKLDRLMESRAH